MHLNQELAAPVIEAYLGSLTGFLWPGQERDGLTDWSGGGRSSAISMNNRWAPFFRRSLNLLKCVDNSSYRRKNCEERKRKPSQETNRNQKKSIETKKNKEKQRKSRKLVTNLGAFFSNSLYFKLYKNFIKNGSCKHSSQ